MTSGQKAAAFISAGLIVLLGIGVRSTQQGPTSHAQSLTVTPSQGTQGVQGTAGATGATGATGPTGPTGTVIQSSRATTATDGTYTWTYPVAYGAGIVPIIECLSQATSGSTDVINCQLDGAPANTAAKFRITRTQVTVVSLLGLSILSVPASPGATNIHITAQAP